MLWLERKKIDSVALLYQPQIDFNVFRQLSAILLPLDNVVARVRYAWLEIPPN